MNSPEGTAERFAGYVHEVASQLGDDVTLLDSDVNSDLATALIVIAARGPDLAEHELLLVWRRSDSSALHVHTE